MKKILAFLATQLPAKDFFNKKKRERRLLENIEVVKNYFPGIRVDSIQFELGGAVFETDKPEALLEFLLDRGFPPAEWYEEALVSVAPIPEPTFAFEDPDRGSW